jgi:very-long-chain (3R)-3-hydroxyacyl-CoA dehydratase
VPATPTPVKVYLVAYNALSAIGWAYVLTLLLIHLFDLDGKSGSFTAAPKSATGFFSRILPFLDSKAGAVQSNLPPWLKPIHTRATTSYSRAGAATAFVQSFAALEVLHAALGWVRSPVPTTAMQVASRLFLVWGIMAQFTGVSFIGAFFDIIASQRGLGSHQCLVRVHGLRLVIH